MLDLLLAMTTQSDNVLLNSRPWYSSAVVPRVGPTIQIGSYEVKERLRTVLTYRD